MAIIITGTPGTGKTTLAEKIADDYGYSNVNITKLLEDRGLDSQWDSQRNCFLVDVEQLQSILEGLIEHDPDIVIDGHMSHYLDPRHVERCIVTKCALPELKSRLEQRDYSSDKVRENLDAEIFDVCFVEAIEYGHDPEVLWTSEQAGQ